MFILFVFEEGFYEKIIFIQTKNHLLVTVCSLALTVSACGRTVTISSDSNHRNAKNGYDHDEYNDYDNDYDYDDYDYDNDYDYDYNADDDYDDYNDVYNYDDDDYASDYNNLFNSTNSVPEKPVILEEDVRCEDCDGEGQKDCGYCGGTGILYEKYPCTCDNGKVNCYSCGGKGEWTEYYIQSDMDSSGYKKIDMDYYDGIWNHYLNGKYYQYDVPFETYYDYIYNQVLLRILNQSVEPIQYDILSGFDTTDNFEYSTIDQVPGTLCAKCHGAKKITCPSCHGAGKLESQKEAANYSGGSSYSYNVSQDCPLCHGAREIDCTLCHGKGTY